MPGPQLSYNGIGPMWANAANTPFRYWKKEQYEGGTATPFIVHWPAGLKTAPERLRTGRATWLTSWPRRSTSARRAFRPISAGGRQRLSRARALSRSSRAGSRGPERTIYFEHFGARGIRKGGWKLVSPAGKPWELYDLANDRTETRNLAGAEPGRVRQLAADFEAGPNAPASIRCRPGDRQRPAAAAGRITPARGPIPRMSCRLRPTP